MGSGAFILSLRTSGTAQGVFQPKLCHSPSHPFLRTIRSAPLHGLPDLLHLLPPTPPSSPPPPVLSPPLLPLPFLLHLLPGLRLVEPLPITARLGHRPR